MVPGMPPENREMAHDALAERQAELARRAELTRAQRGETEDDGETRRGLGSRLRALLHH